MNYYKFAQDLIYWYEMSKRDLPWRKTKDPYLIWLSEIILQQTRVNQGLPYYLKFAETYPTLQNLAAAEENDVLRLWQGLGYYSRARNMLKTARFISHDLNGVFPKTYKDLLKLKGIGRYTAGAIASFAYDELVPVVDGNVMRVLSRVFGVFEDISSAKGQNVFIELAGKILPKDSCDTFNQALMEFGAITCMPKKPKCEECIFNHTCYAYKKDHISSLPVKIKRQIKTERTLSYFVISQNNKLLMRQRKEKDIWKGLFEFYLKENHFETLSEYLPDEVLINMEENCVEIISPTETTTHVLTHQIIKARFWEIRLKKGVEIPLKSDNLKFYSIEEITGLPKSILIMKYLNKNIF
ncbi:MAG TPA: A/G-specific adenine glycosylase [Cytophagales bacterium]|nr:A/G-specific adenine glycosylase [Cytophagales bacterium]